MKTVYPVVATALSAVLLCGCLRYNPHLITEADTDPSFTQGAETKAYSVGNLPFVPPETTTEETADRDTDCGGNDHGSINDKSVCGHRSANGVTDRTVDKKTGIGNPYDRERNAGKGSGGI